MRPVLPVVCVLAAMLGACGNTLDGRVKSAGYLPLPLPSTEYQPGQVILVQSEQPFTTVTVCNNAQYGSPTVEKDTGATTNASSKVGGNVDVTADYKSKLSGKVNVTAVRNVTLTLNNVQVEQVTGASVVEAVPRQSAGCTSAIKLYQGTATKPVFLQKALKADLTYTVTFDAGAGLSAEATKEALRGIAANVSAGLTVSNDNTISGNGLYIGVLRPTTVLVRTAAPAVALGPVRSPYVLTPSSSSIPCGGRTPCSPDGKWFAVETKLTLLASQPGRTLAQPSVDCDDGGNGACVFRNAVFDTSPDRTKVTATITTWSVPVRVRVAAIEWGTPQ